MKKTIGLSLVIAFLAGCASSGTRGGASIDRQIYLQGRSSEPAGSEKAMRGKCIDKAGLLEEKNWKEIVRIADACASEKKWSGLELVANTLAKKDIHSPWGSYFLSVVAESRGDMQRALWMLDLATKKAGNDIGLFHYQRGRILWQMGELSKGMDEVAEAVRREPNLMQAHLFLAEIYLRDQEFSKAAPHFETVLKEKADEPVAYAGLVECYLHKGDGKAAIAVLNQAISNHPVTLQFRLRLAYVYEKVENDTERALAAYRSLKNLIDNGRIKEKPGIDIGAKIKALESTIEELKSKKQASVQNPMMKRSK